MFSSPREVKSNSKRVTDIIGLHQLGLSELTLSPTEKGGDFTDSSPMSTQRHPSTPRLRLGVLESLFVDIGSKLHLVHFVVKFSSAS